MFTATESLRSVGIANDGGGEHQDPGTGEVLATTEGLAAGTYHAIVTIAAMDLDDSKALLEIQRRNSADEEDAIENLIVAVWADSTEQFECAFALEEQERITVVPYPVGFNGRVIVAINWQRVS